MADDTKKLRYITDEAATTDDFGTHANIARTLLDIISDKDNKPMTIGLEGSWGSGKSTVVNLMFKDIDHAKNISEEEKANETETERKRRERLENIEYFYIDVWQHEHSCIKRAILHEMIESLNKKLKKDKKVKNVKKQLEGSIQTTNIGFFGILSAVILAIIAGLYSNIDFEKITLIGNDINNNILISIILIGLLPLSYFLIKLFSSSKIIEQTTTTFENSSIEFSRHYNEILEVVKKKDQNAIPLIVFDNLDRIDEENAKKMWAELQVFMQYRNPGATEKEKQARPWIIIPYDIDGIKKIWGEDENEDNTTRNDSNAKTLSKSSKSKDKVRSFLQKTFQIVQPMPEPLLNTWKRYLLESLKLTKADKDLQNKIYNLISDEYSEIGSLPTARDIRILLNHIIYYYNNPIYNMRIEIIIDFCLKKCFNQNFENDFWVEYNKKVKGSDIGRYKNEELVHYFQLFFSCSYDSTVEIMVDKVLNNIHEDRSEDYVNNMLSLLIDYKNDFFWSRYEQFLYSNNILYKKINGILFLIEFKDCQYKIKIDKIIAEYFNNVTIEWSADNIIFAPQNLSKTTSFIQLIKENRDINNINDISKNLLKSSLSWLDKDRITAMITTVNPNIKQPKDLIESYFQDFKKIILEISNNSVITLEELEIQFNYTDTESPRYFKKLLSVLEYIFTDWSFYSKIYNFDSIEHIKAQIASTQSRLNEKLTSEEIDDILFLLNLIN